MSSRRRTSPPPDSMAGSFTASSGLVVILVGVSFLGGLFGSLTCLRLLDGFVLRLDLFDRGLLGIGAFGGFRLDRGLRRSGCGDRRRLLRRTRLARPIGL